MNHFFKRLILAPRKWILLFAGCIFALLLNEILFHYLAKANAERYFTGVTSILNNEMSVGNSYLISRSLSDLERLGFISCVNLDELFPSKRNFYNTNYQSDCDVNAVFRNLRYEGVIKGSGGNTWHLSFIAPPSTFFTISIWLGRIFSILLMSIVFVFVDYLLIKAEQRRLNEAMKVEQIRDLAFQVAHDVASPLSALNLISGIPSLDSEVKELLTVSTRRTSDIIRGLRDKITHPEGEDNFSHEKIDLVKIVGEIALELKASTDIVKLRATHLQMFCQGSKVEIGRVVSNILNNAIEACEDRNSAEIDVQMTVTEGYVNLIVRDNGCGISSDKLQKLGNKGFTFGKKRGSGYGLFHAKTYLQSIGGKLEIESEVGKGTTVTLSFKSN